jgi:GTPase SAR1 family protein
MTEVKVLMVGPMNSGKSALTNFIADAVQNSENPRSAPTQPTKGVRIVEFDRKIRDTKKGEVSESRERQRGAKVHVCVHACASGGMVASVR